MTGPRGELRDGLEQLHGELSDFAERIRAVLAEAVADDDRAGADYARRLLGPVLILKTQAKDMAAGLGATE